MNGIDPLICAIVGHLVGDYLIQTDWMALNKKRSSLACAIHCLLWTLAVCAFAGWWVWWVPLVLFGTHFAQDRTGIILWWMKLRWKDQSGFAGPPCAPWSIIVVDNVWHVVTLYCIALALGGAS